MSLLVGLLAFVLYVAGTITLGLTLGASWALLVAWLHARKAGR